MNVKLKYSIIIWFMLLSCTGGKDEQVFFKISREDLADKIKGAWALQTIGVTYGGPTEFDYRKETIPDSVSIAWSDTMMYHWMTRGPGLYDDIYMDLTFVDIFQKEGLDAPASSFANAYANAGYYLWHANQQGRYNILNGIMPPESGSWKNNPHADDIDYQIESDFAGIMNPGMPNGAAMVSDRIGHIMNSGDGYYGGIFISAMYSYAFINNEMEEIIGSALACIPKESSYYQCISDVIGWYKMYPNNWRTAWEELEKKWGEDIGCPDGAAEGFNIDAKMNSAYVVIGLLYGKSDIDRTMEIATRCGQDSDCNPSSAAGVLGTVTGYKAIPPKWASGLTLIENMDFQHTTISLNEAYKISLDHALAMIAMNGGDTIGNEIKIKLQEPSIMPLEVNFPSYKLAGKADIQMVLDLNSKNPFETEFEGIGFVLRGAPRNMKFMDTYALLDPEQTMNDFILEVKCTVDSQDPFVVKLPLNFLKRSPEVVCYRYELAQGKHNIKVEPLNMVEGVQLQLWDMIVYTR
ncbi:MAG TPA: ADP-ribosylglycohydrolase family protein [Cyclobacteriaceae bacterium]|nr:ADP-ribosylglycohydrolase family protein [Cyclobacteriaceae bacterium]